jgi:transcriptional regulator with XRE-family HTH domain
MAARIKERRDLLGYTQEQFAEIIDLSVSSYTKIENAFQKPALDTLIRIAAKLNVSLDFLVFGGDKPPKPTDAEVMSVILDFADSEKLAHAKDLIGKIIKAKSR